MYFVLFFFFKQKTAYEMRISDWSSDVCSSDLAALVSPRPVGARQRLILVLDGQYAVADRESVEGQRHDAARAFVRHHLEVIGFAANHHAERDIRSEERRVGKECVSTCRSRWSQYP